MERGRKNGMKKKANWRTEGERKIEKKTGEKRNMKGGWRKEQGGGEEHVEREKKADEAKMKEREKGRRKKMEEGSER